MPNSKTAKKRVLTNELSRQRNMAVKSRMKTYIKAAETAIQGGDAKQAGEAVTAALSEIDRAMSKGILPKNTGARRKSSLQRKANTLGKK